MELTWLSAILFGAIGYFIGSKYPPRFLFSAKLAKQLNHSTSNTGNSKAKAPLEIEQLAEMLDDFKMWLGMILRWVKGRLLLNAEGHQYKDHGELIHATLGLYKKVLYRAPKALNRWEMCAQPKVVVKIESEEDMLALQERAKSLKLPTHITIDAGKTQIAPNSRTVMAIFGPVEVVDDVTGGLKLL